MDVQATSARPSAAAVRKLLRATTEPLGLEAERTYVDLLYALQTENPEESQTAAYAFDEQIRQLRHHWYRPLSDNERDDVRYHVDQAECAYEDARESIEAGQLDRAMVQLDRAVFELNAGDPASLHELYIGSIYDFVASWLEVDYLVREDGCEVPWEVLIDCAQDARSAWRQVRGYQPADYLYFDRQVDPGAFTAAHIALDRQVEAFYGAIKYRDPVQLCDRVNEVSEKLWNLVLLFGSPPVPPDAPM